MTEPHTQQGQPANANPTATVLIALDRDAIIDIARTPIEPLPLVERSTRIRASDLEVITPYEAANDFGGWLITTLDRQTADICDFLISDVMGGAQTAVHIARRYALSRTNVRQKSTAGDIPDFLHDPKVQNDGEEDDV